MNALATASAMRSRQLEPRLGSTRGWWHLCCRFHMAMMMPMGMGADAGAAAPAGPVPSFTDGTSPVISPFAFAGDAQTRDLYETAAPGQWLVVRGATVLPMTAQRSLPAHDVLARDGVIQAVQPSGAALPEGALVVEAAGRFVMPGLSEMHSHPGVLNHGAMWAPLMGPNVTGTELTLPYDLLMFLYLASGITRMQAMAGTPEALALRDAIRGGHIRGPAMRVASPVIDGYPPIWSPAISWLVRDADGARQAARLIHARGYDFAKPYTKLGDEAYVAFARECRALGVEMTGHIPKSIRVEEALALGQRGVAHVFEYFANTDDPERFDLDAMARKARMSAELGVTVHSTMIVSRVFEYDVGLRPDGCDAAAFMDPVMRYLMNEQSAFIQGWRNNPEMVQQGTDNFLHSIQITQALLAAGVRLVTGTDIPNPNGTGRQSLHEEFELLVRDVGMAPIDVLRASTVHAAEHMGESALAGTLERGKRADLVVLERDPSTDILATREIDAVVVGNAVLRKEAIARGTARAIALYDAMPVPKL